MKLKFIYNDLDLCYKTLNSLIPIALPHYISVKTPESIIGLLFMTAMSKPTVDAFRHSFYYDRVINTGTLLHTMLGNLKAFQLSVKNTCGRTYVVRTFWVIHGHISFFFLSLKK